jgi:Cys-tRNA(Pro)/Cys-tRNA(Cys) deacylase
MDGMTFQGKVVIPGEARGTALVSREPLSFWGGYDWQTGEIIDRRHELSGSHASGAILAIPFTRGSSTTTAVLLEAIRAGTAPAAILTTGVDFFFSLASVVADELYSSILPLIALDEQDFKLLQTGDEIHVTMDGRITVNKMVTKLPSHTYLDEHKIPYERKTFPPETEKGAANVAHVLGFSERQAVKTLIFQVDTGERVLVMLGGDQNAVSGNLKKAIGSRNIRMADPEIVKETTGYVVGSIPAFGWQPPGFRSFLEASLLDEPILGTGAGQWGEEIMITPEQLVLASQAIVVNLTDRDRPVHPENSV